MYKLLEMDCYFCNYEYDESELVFHTPIQVCPFCVLGHGRGYSIGKEYQTTDIIDFAVKLVKSPRMIHRLRCIIPRT